MYDMKPVRISKRSSYIKFTDAMEHAMSTQRHLDKLHAPVVVTHGTDETPEFQRQNRDFVAAKTDVTRCIQNWGVQNGLGYLQVMARIETIRMHLDRYRQLSAQGKWADAGKELEAVESAVKK
jgi:hypothetical protein